jgi:hypothetical protein
MQEFEHFRLPPLLLCDLYRENLIALNEPTINIHPKEDHTHSPGPQAGQSIVGWEAQSRGNNTNGFWILVDTPGEAVLGTEDINYLDSIIRACQRDPEECLVINLHGLDAAAFSSWAPVPAPRHVWMAGVEPGTISLPARFPAFQVQALGEVTYLWSPPLSSIKDRDKKAALWNALKQLFQIR